MIIKNDIALRLQQLRTEIATLEHHYGRPKNSIKLLAVSKTQPVAAIQAAIAAGQYYFAENYCQEAINKIAALSYDQRLEWHFIGSLQRNKAKWIAPYFHWVHSVDNLAIAMKLNTHRPVTMPPLNICLQVNISGEKAKSGISLADLSQLALAVQQMPRLQLRGLMTIGIQGQLIATEKVFVQLREMLQQLQDCGLAVDTLSMGMSQDYIQAIAAGTTMLRIGTKIFGNRITGDNK